MEFLTTYGKMPREKFVVIPNGLSVDYWTSRESERSGKQVVCVAQFRPEKGQGELIPVLKLIARTNPDFECLFAGEGPSRITVQGLVQDLGLANNTRFLGQLNRIAVRDLLASADIFVLPSLVEGLPGSVMEAMASRLPVVATDVGGTRELVIHGETGFLVPRNRPDLFASYIQDLLNNASLRLAMGNRGRKRIEEQFTLEAMVDKTASFYTEVASFTAKRGNRKKRSFSETFEGNS